VIPRVSVADTNKRRIPDGRTNGTCSSHRVSKLTFAAVVPVEGSRGKRAKGSSAKHTTKKKGA